jgi:site-specific DNA-methyltransferase (adenine-specific)
MPDPSQASGVLPRVPAPPTPYYDEAGITIYHGDCDDLIGSVGQVDLVVTSPPYNLRSEGHSGSGSEWADLRSGYLAHDDDMPHGQYVAWQRAVLAACWTALTDAGAIFYNHKPLLSREPGRAIRMPFELIPDDLPIRQVITWDRGSGMTRTKCHFVPRYEWVLLLAKDAFRTNTLVVDDLWRIPFDTGSAHPAPFPLALPTKAIGSTDAAIVLDPFMGSGTTLRAAKDLGRRAIGIEKSEAYCEIAARRLSQEVLDFGGVA